MDLPAALLRDLLQLTTSIDVGEDALTGPLEAIIGDLRSAVPSYRGLHVTIVDSGSRIGLTAFSIPDGDGAISSSLRLPFTLFSAGFDPDSQIVLYAATPGAFVDLAADLSYALTIPTTTSDPASGEADSGGSQSGRPDGDQPRRIVLDADLPPTILESGLTGLAEVTTINRAVGVLIEQGHHPDHAPTILRDHAAAAGVQTHVYAARLLRR